MPYLGHDSSRADENGDLGSEALHGLCQLQTDRTTTDDHLYKSGINKRERTKKEKKREEKRRKHEKKRVG